MRHLVIILGMTPILMLSACSKANKEHTHWSYQGETAPEHWAKIEKDSQCGGSKQSPVNIINTNTEYSAGLQSSLKFNYVPQTHIHDVVNNGHSIQFDFEPGDSIDYQGKRYQLIHFHFHEPSEHTIDGIRYPIEMHLVHRNEDNNFAVLSIMGREGEVNQPFEFLESFLPIKSGEKKIIDKAFDLRNILPKDASQFFVYSGSLTTPPCTENVEWIVFKDQIVLSEQEVLRLKKNMPKNNYRNEQPLNGRTVSRSMK